LRYPGFVRGPFLTALLLAILVSPGAFAADAPSFTVQVASTSKRDEAERLVALLAGRDIAAYWTEASVGGKTVYRVRVGSFPTREAAKQLGEELPAEFGLEYWIAPEEPRPTVAIVATPTPAPAAKPAASASPKATSVAKVTPAPALVAKATPAIRQEDASEILTAAMAVHGGATGGFAAVDRAASVLLSYRLKSLDAKTGAPVFTRHAYRRKGKDRLRLEISAIEEGATLARDASGKPIVAASSVTVHAPGGSFIQAEGRLSELAPSTARARIEALGPAGMLRLPLAFPNRGSAAVGISKATVAGTRTLNGAAAVRIDANPPPKPYREASLYVDPGSQRLIAARFLTDAGELLLTFSDYRTVAPNLIVPFERVVYRDGAVVSSVEIDTFTLDTDMEDALFTGGG
jgi:hypothetical protein